MLGRFVIWGLAGYGALCLVEMLREKGSAIAEMGERRGTSAISVPREFYTSQRSDEWVEWSIPKARRRAPTMTTRSWGETLGPSIPRQKILSW